VPDPLAAIAAGRDWLERHAPYLLPDALVFAEIGLRAAQLPLPRRLKPPGAGRIAETVIPLSPAFRTIAAATGPLYLGYRGEPPLAGARVTPARGTVSRRRRRSTSASLDGVTINRALAEAVRGRPSPVSLRWMRRRRQRDFVLTHQLLAWLFCVWSQVRPDARLMARRLAGAVFREAARVGGYHDLLAQQSAFLALGAWPPDSLRGLVGRILASQDAADGGWHYFEVSSLDASASLSRVLYGLSPLIGGSIPREETQLAALARTLHRVHRGHATGLSICALGVLWEATGGTG
jgi:hypothetical protein